MMKSDKIICLLLITALAPAIAVGAQSPSATHVIGSVHRVEVAPDSAFLTITLDSAIDVRDVAEQMPAPFDAVVDLPFLEALVGKYLANGKSLTALSGGPIAGKTETLVLPTDWFAGLPPAEYDVVVADGNVGLAVYDRTGRPRRVIMNSDRVLQMTDASLRVSQGRMLECDASRSGCDTETAFLIGSQRFVLTPGQAYDPSDPHVASVLLLRAQREQKPTGEPWEDLLYGVMFDSEFSPKNAKGPFLDVEFSHPYREAVTFVKEEGIVKGYDDGTFRPERNLNRAEFSKMLLETVQDDSYCEECLSYPGELRLFPDVVYRSWYGPYVCMAKYRGIVGGYPDGTFRPEQSITFAEAAKIVSVAMRLPFDSATTDEEWYAPHIRAVEEAEAVPPTIRSPDQRLTRAEFAFMLHALER